VSQIRRIIFSATLFIAMMVLGVIYIRAGLPLMDRCNGGPFCGPVETMRIVLPVVIGGMLLFSALYAIAGPVQQEESARRVQQEVRRR